jgi:hypothetical protein
MTLTGYKGNCGERDTGYFFCPYRPGMTQDEIAAVNETIKYDCRPDTEFQTSLMQSIRDNPTINYVR